MTRSPVIGLICWLVLVSAAAGLGGLASMQAGAFYAALDQPSWAPPGWLFGPVWSVLYLMMGVAAWLIWKVHGFRGAPWALGLFLVQLVLNALWTWLFFAWHLGQWSVIEIAVLWVLIVCTLIAFWRRSPLAGALMVPYLVWVSFASLLAYAMWARNPTILG